MKNKELIFESIKIIENNIEEPIFISDLADKIGFSTYYFSNLFKGITGISPKSYILGRKLTLSASDLIQSDVKIIDIAFKYGFGSHEAYTRAFQRIFGLTPFTVRKNRCYPKNRIVKVLTLQNIQQKDHIVNMIPEIVMKDEIKLVGISFFYDINIRNDLTEQWEHLMNNLKFIKNRKKAERFYQLQYWFPKQEHESIYFFIATEVNYFEDIPIQLTQKVIPKQKYLRFQHEGVSNKVGYTYKYIYNEYLPETDYKLKHLFNFEFFGEKYLGPYNENSISEIYIPISVDKNSLNN